MKPIALLCPALLALIGALPAFADPQPAASPSVPAAAQEPKPHVSNASSSRSSLPEAGDIELLLEAPPILNATNLTPGVVTRGLGIVSSNAAGGSTTVGLGLNGGVGYYLTDFVEAGAAVAIDYGQCLSGGSGGGFLGDLCGGGTIELALEPFVKLNFGRLLARGRLNPFAQVGLIAGGASGSGYGTGLFGFDVDLGIDVLISRGWGIAVFLPFSLLAPTAPGATVFGYGLGYGLVTYL